MRKWTTAIGLWLVSTSALGDDLYRHLQGGGYLACAPKFARLCANIHVACAGRSQIMAPEIDIHTHGDLAFVWADNERLRVGPLHHSEQLIVHFHDDTGYLRLFESGRYVMRIYLQGQAYMTLGSCEAMMAPLKE